MHKRTAAAGTSRRLWKGEHTQRQRKRGRMREREREGALVSLLGFYLSQPLALHFVYMLLMQLARFSLWFTPRRLGAECLKGGQTIECFSLSRHTHTYAHTHTWVHAVFLLFAYLFVCLLVCLPLCLFVSFLSTYLWVPARLSSFVTPILPICQMARRGRRHLPLFATWLHEQEEPLPVRCCCSLCARRCSLVYATIFISNAAATSLPSVSIVPTPSPTPSPSPSCSRSWRRRRRRSPCHSHLRSLTLLPDARTNAYCLCPGA